MEDAVHQDAGEEPAAHAQTVDETPASRGSRTTLRAKFRRYWAVLALVTYLAGLGSGYMLRGAQAPAGEPDAGQAEHADMEALAQQINPQEGYQLPATYGDIGPQLIEAGAIDLDRFVQLYQEMGRPLTEEQVAILTEGSSEPVVINPDNQHFLLNLFWAFGLANENPVLTGGPMMSRGEEGVVNFASTGGWTLSTRPVSDLYAGAPLVALDEAQQRLLEEVAKGVFRPCCDNPTHFPDCNHGMAMLGLLELMASQGASRGEMFEAAKYVNAYWFPQQTLEVALAFKATQNEDFKEIEGERVVSAAMSSGSGFRTVHQWLVQNGKLEQAPQGGGSCGVK